MKRRADKGQQRSAYDRGLSLLARREHSQREMRARLERGGYDKAEAGEAIKRLGEQKYQDDDRFGEMILRARGIGHLALCGVVTSGVVLSTVRHAFDLDFRLTVVKDACADRDPEVHRVLTEKVFPAQAKVVTAEEFAANPG